MAFDVAVRELLAHLDSADPTGLPPAVVFDVDGTLVDVSGIRHLLDDPVRDFEAFHQASLDCPPHGWVVDLARAVADAGAAPLVVTARRERFGFLTALWLSEHGVPYVRMEMRGRYDSRPDREVKGDILTRLRRRFQVVAAVDDNPAVLGLWAENNIPTVVVPGWADQN